MKNKKKCDRPDFIRQFKSKWDIPHSRKPRYANDRLLLKEISKLYKVHLRNKRALKGGGSSRAVGSIHKSSGSQISLR